MASSRLDNYLRTYRKRSGLTQNDIAFLLGRKSAAQISRYERRRSVPSLRTAFACCSILGICAEKLFSGVQQKGALATARRIDKLLSAFENGGQSRSTNAHKRKVRWLNESKGRIHDLGGSVE